MWPVTVFDLIYAFFSSRFLAALCVKSSDYLWPDLYSLIFFLRSATWAPSSSLLVSSSISSPGRKAPFSSRYRLSFFYLSLSNFSCSRSLITSLFSSSSKMMSSFSKLSFSSSSAVIVTLLSKFLRKVFSLSLMNGFSTKWVSSSWASPSMNWLIFLVVAIFFAYAYYSAFCCFYSLASWLNTGMPATYGISNYAELCRASVPSISSSELSNSDSSALSFFISWSLTFSLPDPSDISSMSESESFSFTSFDFSSSPIRANNFSLCLALTTFLRARSTYLISFWLF